MTTKEAVALLERYSNYDGMGIQNLAGCKEAMRVAVDALKEACPELCESEDERIRRTLVEYFGPKVRLNFVRGIPIQKIRDWLEKQKEKSMSATEVLARAGLKPYKDGNQWCILAGDNIQEGICGFGDTIDEALYQFLMEVLEKQKKPHFTKRNALFDKCVENCDPTVMKKVSDEVDEMLEKEQKFTHHEVDESLAEVVTHQMEDDGDVDDFVRKGLDDVVLKYAELGAKWQKEQKTAEWSEKHIADIFEKVGLAKIAREQGNDELTNALQDAMLELSKVENTEWSEENEKELDYIINILDRLGFEEFCKSSRDQDIEEERFYYKEIQFLKRLKSLRPDSYKNCNSRWKPSEEQKDAVFHACNRMVGDRYHAAICSVYEQLKKLM